MDKLNTSFRLDRSLLTSARKLAQHDHMTLTQFVTMAILRAVRKRRTFMACLCLALLLTGCVSQAQREAEQRWYDSLTTEQQVRLEERRMQALGMFLGGGGFRSFQPRPYYPPVSQPVQPYAPLSRPSTNCLANVVGDTVYMNCN